jgi:hypothetical protein
MGSSELRLEVYGRRFAAVHGSSGWRVFHLGNDGKRRAAEISLPPSLPQAEVAEFMADLLHEIATPRHNQVRVLP